VIIETYDTSGRRLLVAFTESSVAYRDITNVYRWYRGVFVPGIAASVVLVIGSIAYSILMYQNVAVRYPYQPYYILIGGFAASIIILIAVRLSRPKVEWQATVIPAAQVWVINVYSKSGIVHVYRYGSQTPELSLKLSGKDLVRLLNSLGVEPWVRKVMVYEQ